MASPAGSDADTQRTTSRNSRKRVIAGISKTQRIYVKCAGAAGAGLEIAFPDDSFSYRNPQTSPNLTKSRNYMRPDRSVYS